MREASDLDICDGCLHLRVEHPQPGERGVLGQPLDRPCLGRTLLWTDDRCPCGGFVEEEEEEEEEDA